MSKNNILLDAIKSNSLLIEDAIVKKYATYQGCFTAEICNAELYSLTAGGKRIRAFLVNEFCKACGGRIENSIDFAVAVEMMHTFSLIHDDLPCMDDDDLRRGKPTSHKMFGESTALLAGYSLAARSLATIAANANVDSSAAQTGVMVLADAVSCKGMIGGQVIDMSGEEQLLDFDTLLELHSKKTGALMVASAKLGCLAAGIQDTDIRYSAAADYAEKIGLAFQIVDDVLDYTSDSLILGKNVGVDRSRNKTTFLTFMSVDDAREYAQVLTNEAKEALSVLDNTECLFELADYLLTRES